MITMQQVLNYANRISFLLRDLVFAILFDVAIHFDYNTTEPFLLQYSSLCLSFMLEFVFRKSIVFRRIERNEQLSNNELNCHQTET